MSGGPPRRGYGRSSGRSTGGTNTPTGGGGGGPRRPGRGGNDVLPLITGVLGSSILAFSLYVLSHNPGVFGADHNHPTVVEEPQCCGQPEASCVGSSCHSDEQPCLVHGDPNSINPEKRKFLTYEEEAIVKERHDKSQYRGKLQRQLKQHLRKVKELTDELEKDEQAEKRNWPRGSWWSNDDE